MNITWILGNGFDLNLGMKTSYKDFYDNHYSRLDDSVSIAHRTRIKTIGTKLDLSPLLWSDLELFIGQSAGEYNSFDEFHATYIHMQNELNSYLSLQQQNFESAVVYREYPIEKIVEEFEDSIGDLSARLDLAESRYLINKLGLFPSLGKQAVVTLNYTNLIDVLLARSKNIFVDPIHAHGALGERGLINFGVSDIDQVKNDNFDMDDCRDCWTKQGRSVLHGNMSLDSAYQLIRDANLLVFYGISFGLTDYHIWQKISEELHKRSDLILLIFDYDLPDKGDPYLWKRKSRELKSSLIKKLEIGDIKDIDKRVLLLNSLRVFNFGVFEP